MTNAKSFSATPVTGPCAWLSADQARRDDWVVHLEPSQIRELSHAAESCRLSGLQLGDVTPDDFSLPSFEPLIRRIRNELQHGRGFMLVRGLNVHDYTLDELALIFWGIGICLGVGVSQGGDGDRLGHVVNKGSTDRYYMSGGPIEFHMESVDVVGLVCVRPAMVGGQSRVASSCAIHNILLEERPDLLEILYRGFYCSRKGHGETVTDWRVPVFCSRCWRDGKLFPADHNPPGGERGNPPQRGRTRGHWFLTERGVQKAGVS